MSTRNALQESSPKWGAGSPVHWQGAKHKYFFIRWGFHNPSPCVASLLSTKKQGHATLSCSVEVLIRSSLLFLFLFWLKKTKVAGLSIFETFTFPINWVWIDWQVQKLFGRTDIWTQTSQESCLFLWVSRNYLSQRSEEESENYMYLLALPHSHTICVNNGPAQ